jgi:xanthine dehydrogenase accessory factor
VIGTIVLAAGRSERMGSPKLLVRVKGRPLLSHTLDAVRRSGVGAPVVVLGHEAERVRREVSLDGATVVLNPDYPKGMSTSLRVAIRASDPAATAFLILLADQPFVAPSTLNALARRWKPGGPKILIPTYHGLRGNPVLVDRTLAHEIDRISGDVGFREIFEDHPEDIFEVPVEDPGVLFDLDTPEQLDALQEALAAKHPLKVAVTELVASSLRGHRERRPSHPRTHVMALAQELEARGEPFVLATVVRATRPTSGKPGNRALVRANRELVGWVGGSCTDSAVLAESAIAMREGKPRLLRLSRDAGLRPAEEGVVEHYMECHSGGSMDIYVEPHVPKPRLLVVGDSPVAETLVALGHLMDYHVILAAPRSTPEAFPEADEVVDGVARIEEFAKAGTYAVVATMGKYDEAALRALVPSNLPYVALVASRKRASAVTEELRREGIPEEALGRIRNPAGLDLNAKTPEEIALSIMAEVTKVRRTETSKEIPVVSSVPAAAKRAALLDVVCGMEVDPGTPLKAEHHGATYYFCSEMCRTRFLESPLAFLR